MTIAPTARGLAVKSTAQDQRYMPLWPSGGSSTASPWERPTTAVTVIAYFRRTAAPAGDTPIFAWFDPTNSPPYSWGLQESAGGKLSASVAEPWADTVWASTTSGWADGNPHIAVGVWSSNTQTLLYLDGTLVGTAPSPVTGPIPYGASATGGPTVGNWWNYTGGNRSWQGEVYGGTVAPVALSASEIAALRSDSDFWGLLFASSPRRIYFDAGAGGDTYSLTASNLTGGTPSLQSATLTQDHGLTAANLAGTSATLQSPALTQNHVVTASNLNGAAPTIGSPALTLAGTFVATDLVGAQPVLGTPALTQQHSLTVTALTGAAATLGAPALTQNHVVTAANLTSAAPVLGSPTVVLGGTIVADNILGATPIFGSPALTQQHSLTATPLLGASAILGSPAFGQQHLLTGSDIVGSAPTLGSPDLTSGSSGGTGATAEEVAAAVLAALNATAIPVNVQQVHSVPLAGVGSDGDPWRAA